jgi:hypothetical protein
MRRRKTTRWPCTPPHFFVSAPVAPGASEIANASEAVQDGRIYIERVNGPFLEESGTPD